MLGFYTRARRPSQRFPCWSKGINPRLQNASVLSPPVYRRLLMASWRAKRAAKSAPAPTTNTTDKPDLFSRADELGTDNLVYLQPTNAVWNDAWQVTEQLVLRMRDDVTRSGAKFLVVTLSNGPQVLPDPRAREYFMQRFGITDLFYPDNRIKALGEREGISVITLAPELQQYAQQNNMFLHGFGSNIGNGHWNVEGNRVAGQLIAKKICEDGLPK